MTGEEPLCAPAPTGRFHHRERDVPGPVLPTTTRTLPFLPVCGSNRHSDGHRADVIRKDRQSGPVWSHAHAWGSTGDAGVERFLRHPSGAWGPPSQTILRRWQDDEDGAITARPPAICHGMLYSSRQRTELDQTPHIVPGSSPLRTAEKACHPGELTPTPAPVRVQVDKGRGRGSLLWISYSHAQPRMGRTCHIVSDNSEGLRGLLSRDDRANSGLR